MSCEKVAHSFRDTLKLTTPRILAIAGVIMAAIVHTWFVATGRTSYSYERLSDVIVIVVALGLGAYTIKLWRSDLSNAALYLVLTNIYLIITVIHGLRFFFGGLHCG